MKHIDDATDEFIAVILSTDAYRNYRRELERVKQEPGLKEQIDEYRKRN